MASCSSINAARFAAAAALPIPVPRPDSGSRTIGAQTSTERAYYISSRAPDAAVLGQLVHCHWPIEISLHWTLDVTFNEGRSRIRSKNGTQNFAALRKLALALLKRETSIPKLTSVARKRKRAACSNDYLLTVLRTTAMED